MKLQLILMGHYPSCETAEEIWQAACDSHDIELEVLDLDSAEGSALADRLGLKSFPALIKNNQVLAIGNPDAQTASELLDDLLEVDSGAA